MHEVQMATPQLFIFPICPSLAMQHLNNCKQLAKLVIVAANLKLLHVGGCKSLANISLRCPQMTQLVANLCFRWHTS